MPPRPSRCSFSLALLSVLSALGACSESTESLTARPDRAQDAGAADTGVTPDATVPDASDPCDAPPPTARLEAPPAGCAPLPDFPSLRDSPRSDGLAERLALQIDEPASGVASQTTYRQVYRDLCRMRQISPRIDEFARGFEAITSVTLEVDAETFEQIEAETYEGWRCLNAQVGAGAARTNVVAGRRQVYLLLAGRIAPRAAESLYGELPGVLSVRASAFFTGQPRTTCAQAQAGGRTYWLFSGFGDCPSGCISWRIFRFTGTDDGVEVEVDLTGPRPDIFDDRPARDCY